MQTAQIIDDDTFTDFKTLDFRYIRVLRAKTKADIEKIDNEYVLVDAFVDGFGGEGKRLALEWFDDIDCSKIILAGGLNSDNLKELSGYNFYGVDVSSGVESYKGKKDKDKIVNFIKAVNEI